jgi:toxin-antitoxin system PIN domain toxin
MTIPDVNLLLYAYDSESPSHARAAAWWRGCLSGVDPVGLLPVVVFGFVRVATSARAFRRPLSTADAVAHVRSWAHRPVTQVLECGPDDVEKALGLLQQVGAAGNLVTDAQIAAAAIEHHAVVHTSDADFVRFPGVRWFNPISGLGSRSLKSSR